MDKFIVNDMIPSFAGVYPIELGGWTMRELNIIKRISGYRGGELAEGFAAGDTDLLLAVAVIAVRRNNRDWETFEKIAWDVDADFLTFENGDVKEAADEPDPLSENGSNGNEPGPTALSGLPSPDDGENSPETNLQATGDPRSVIGAA